jgi:hypothetical protein
MAPEQNTNVNLTPANLFAPANAEHLAEIRRAFPTFDIKAIQQGVEAGDEDAVGCAERMIGHHQRLEGGCGMNTKPKYTRATATASARRVHLLDGPVFQPKRGETFSQSAICGANPLWGFSGFAPSWLKICPKCAARSVIAKAEGGAA